MEKLLQLIDEIQWEKLVEGVISDKRNKAEVQR